MLLVYTVPFLVMPPIAQWALQRFQAHRVIPAGLGLIGLGFLLMKWGTGAAHLDAGQSAVIQGFDWVMFHGAVAAASAAVSSLVAFGRGPSSAVRDAIPRAVSGR